MSQNRLGERIWKAVKEGDRWKLPELLKLTKRDDLRYEAKVSENDGVCAHSVSIALNR